MARRDTLDDLGGPRHRAEFGDRDPAVFPWRRGIADQGDHPRLVVVVISGGTFTASRSRWRSISRSCWPSSGSNQRAADGALLLLVVDGGSLAVPRGRIGIDSGRSSTTTPPHLCRIQGARPSGLGRFNPTSANATIHASMVSNSARHARTVLAHVERCRYRAAGRGAGARRGRPGPTAQRPAGAGVDALSPHPGCGWSSRRGP